MPQNQSQRERSLLDRMISGYRSARYAITEPYNLMVARTFDQFKADDTVDVIIPTYNRCDMLLMRSLPSVLAQTHQKLRVLIAVHGSTDGTFGALHVRYGHDPRVKWFMVDRKRRYPPTAENHWFAGPVDPLNAALRRVKAGWIARMDDDDEWAPDHLESLISYANDEDYEFVSSAHQKPDGEVDPYEMDDGTLIGGCQTWVYRSYLRFFKYNRQCWRKAWDKPNDCDLQDRMWRAGVRMGYLDKVTCYLRPRPGAKHVGLAEYQKNSDNIERFYAFRH